MENAGNDPATSRTDYIYIQGYTTSVDCFDSTTDLAVVITALSAVRGFKVIQVKRR